MKTALLLTTSAQTQQTLQQILGDTTNIVLLPPLAEPGRVQYDALFATWLRLVDIIFIDAAALGETSRWVIEAAAAAPLTEDQTVIIRLADRQTMLHQIPAGWLRVAETDTTERLQQLLTAHLQLRDAQAKLKRADVALARQRQTAAPTLAVPAPGFDSYRYRDALKTLSRVLGHNLDQPALLNEFLRLVRELFGTGKVALFTRRLERDFLASAPVRANGHFVASACAGIAANVIEHFRLTEESGVGAYLQREAKVLRRSQFLDPHALDFDSQIAREFDLLGTEVAVPMFDNDQLLGVLTFSGKITGEALTNEELELAYYLMGQLAQALRQFQLRERLATQQRLLGEVVANVQTGVVVAAEGGQVLSVNTHARQLLELDGPVEKLSALPAVVADVIFEELQTGEAIHKREVTLTRSHRPLSVSVSRLPGGGPVVAVALLEDLTQARLQQAQSRELADKEFFQRIAYRMEHELRNAISSISVFAQLLPEKHGEKEFRDEFSSTVTNEVKRVRLLLDNLKFFSSSLVLSVEPVTLSDLIDRCVRNVTDECERRQIACLVAPNEKTDEGSAVPVIVVKKNYTHKAVVIAGDRIRLMQAFENVLRNAVQALLKEGGRLIINSTDAEAADFPNGQMPAGGAVRIDWQDTGEGIALEQLPRVTKPFVTTRNVGVGLGLTIVKKIVERHGGRLTIDSMLGAGTKVTTLLPVKVSALAEEEPVVVVEERADGVANASRLPVTPKQQKPIVEKKHV
jgi:signal transduction histidine kinase